MNTDTAIRNKPKTIMCQVLLLIESGIIDRDAMAEEIGCTKHQVYLAIQNLKWHGYIEVAKRTSKGYHQGSGETIYKSTGRTHRISRAKGRAPDPNRNPLHGVSSIFNLGASR